MDIAVITETYPPEINGVARTLRAMVEGLRGQGHSLTLIRPSQGRGDQPDTEGGLRQILAPGLPIPRYPELRFGLPIPRRLRRAWAERSPDAIYIATEGPLGRCALRIARELGIPAVSGYHTNFQQYCRHYGLGLIEPAVWGSLKRFHNRSRLTLVPTQDLAAQLGQRGIERLRVFPRGVDTELFNPARRSDALRAAWDVTDGEPVVLYVGRLAAEKNLGLAVRAFEALRTRLGRGRFVLVGDGPELARLKRRHRDFVFTGPKTGIELAEYYASGDLFLFPSITETFGNVVLEAMASGLAIAAYDYAAARQHIRNGRDGMLARFGDNADFVRCALALAESPALVAKAAAGARATAETLGWPRLIGELEELLYQVSDQPRAKEVSHARLAATNE